MMTNPLIIELKGVEFSNKGAALMLEAIVTRLREHFPHIEFALSANAKSPKHLRDTVATYRKITLRKLYFDANALTYYFPQWVHQWLLRRGIVLEGRVDALIDASGFSYSDQWAPYMSIYHLCGELKRMHAYNRPYVFLPQAFGPFNESRCIRLLLAHLDKAALIFARDNASFEHLSQFVEDRNVLQQAGDFTNALPPQALTWPEGLSFDADSKKACIVVNYNMIQSRNAHSQWQNTYQSVVKKLILIYQQRGFNVFFLNHEGRDDASLIDAINQRLSQPLPVFTPSSALEVKSIIAHSDAVFSSRFHGCISALSQGIGCIGTSWSHKYEALYQDYTVPELLLSPDVSDAKLEQTVAQSLAQETHERVHLKARELTANTELMWAKVIAVLKGCK